MSNVDTIRQYLVAAAERDPNALMALEAFDRLFDITLDDGV